MYVINRTISLSKEERMSSIRGFVVLRTITNELSLVIGCYLTFALAKNLD